jgi:hypothetical protein
MTGKLEVIGSSVGLVPTNALVLIEYGPNFPDCGLTGSDSASRIGWVALGSCQSPRSKMDV